MASFVMYPEISAVRAKEIAEENIPLIEQWFKNNPKRRVCNAEFLYGIQLKIKPKTVREQMMAEVDRLIAHGRCK